MVFLTILSDHLSRLILILQPLAGQLARWLVLFIAFTALLDTIFSVLMLCMRDRPMSPQKEKQICLRIVKDREALDLRTALEKYQDSYIAAILKNTPVRESDIPGVWPLVKQRLASNGITSAYEVCPDCLQSMKWLGEVPYRALLDWRASLEDSACASMPRKLPEEQVAKIRARYETLRRKIAEEGI